MRGEKYSRHLHLRRKLGSPPHARGKGFTVLKGIAANGITPACAGKSEPLRACPARRRDHPRMRGEKVYPNDNMTRSTGSPPHARGKVRKALIDHGLVGITPACAGKSVTCSLIERRSEDHPRMRGEKAVQVTVPPLRTGSPPHARGKGLNTSIICCILAQNTYLHRNFV